MRGLHNLNSVKLYMFPEPEPSRKDDIWQYGTHLIFSTAGVFHKVSSHRESHLWVEESSNMLKGTPAAVRLLCSIEPEASGSTVVSPDINKIVQGKEWGPYGCHWCSHV